MKTTTTIKSVTGKLLTGADLRAKYIYSSGDGKLFHRKNGKEAGYENRFSGYWRVEQNNRNRIVWLMFNDWLPVSSKIIVERIDLNPLNDRIENLTVMTKSENSKRHPKCIDSAMKALPIMQMAAWKAPRSEKQIENSRRHFKKYQPKATAAAAAKIKLEGPTEAQRRASKSNIRKAIPLGNPATVEKLRREGSSAKRRRACRLNLIKARAAKEKKRRSA